ncbi:DUF3854 domain-containing protein [Gloeocapsopsis dulcis]|uniref:SF3 helicase domain-containing protein n=1 Tax=Gloeocapsopsis dulcis AAB1 = 1H9 TaxID=1433147 RepID=A0A6N8G3E6_9CHRO|nr:DUF3854 domain-containing protein [Gloeocapsopsis dulcis]MUL39322.1 hypothetical protein [Gloeocapsopsis dulcis AAB1 = 1H9]WNN91568.1 DUF3854 domain-containing protein [Gloeocapsopsis dulcis]
MTQDKNICPNHIHRTHFDEWVKASGVDPQITSLNVKSLVDPCEIDDLLNRNTNRRWQHWEHGPGWAVTGVEPRTGNLTYEGSQFKPDDPVHRQADGKPKFKRDGSPDYQKYFSASNTEATPLFLDTGIPDYWLNILDKPTTRVLITEGAKKAGAALTCGEACISLPGVSNGQRKGRLKKALAQYCTLGRTIVLAFDSDLFLNPNVCKALDKLGRLIAAQGSVVKVLVLPVETKGIDDFIVAQGQEAFRKLVDEALTFEEWKEAYPITPRGKSLPKSASSDKETLYVPPAEDNYILQAKRCLYSNTRWISYNKNLYRWTGTHYEQADPSEEKQRIAAWCASTSVMTSYDWEYRYATATHVENIYNWLLLDFGVARTRINPPGINCLNGRLTIDWEGNKPTWQLNPHNPDIPYTYCSQFNFDPNADPSNCDRLLACLAPEQQEILLKTLAASLDLATIRQYQKDRIRALLCKGDGSNGKDALREAVSQLYSFGVVSASISDFAVYDQQGRKFTLAKLEGARVSWSSENSNFNQLDSLETLKKAITGEPLDIEPKFINEYTINPVAVFLFNINKSPNLQASLEAIQTRYAVLSFNKTFKKNADPSKGELEADPRFRYDPDFIRKEIVPALLNKMLVALSVVAREGIDYSCTDQALSDIQRDTNHLWAFCQDVGLDYQPNGQVSVREIWERLSQWYIDNGTALLSRNNKGNEVLQFLCDPPHRGDKNVKGENQVFQRFQGLFPKAKRGKVNSEEEGKKNRVTLDGIGFREIKQSSDESKASQGKAVVRQLVRQLVRQQGALREESKASKPIVATLVQILEIYSKLSPDEQLAVKKTLFSESEEDQTGLPGFRSAHSKDQLPYDCLTNCLTTALPNHSPEISANGATAPIEDVSDNLGSNVTGGIGNTTNDNSVKNFGNSNPNKHKFKVGDRVQIDCPGSKYHGKIGTITRFKQDHALQLADIRFPRVSRAWEAQISWLRPVPPEQSNQE